MARARTAGIKVKAIVRNVFSFSLLPSTTVFGAEITPHDLFRSVPPASRIRAQPSILPRAKLFRFSAPLAFIRCLCIFLDRRAPYAARRSPLVQRKRSRS